jgi:hypothetical protein
VLNFPHRFIEPAPGSLEKRFVRKKFGPKMTQPQNTKGATGGRASADFLLYISRIANWPG